MALAWAEERCGLPQPAGGVGRIEARGRREAPLAALVALYPELFGGRAGSGSPAVLAAWCEARGETRMRARASMLGVPALVLGCGLLRAPPGHARTAPVLSVTAAAIAGPSSPADALSPDRMLATRAWETPLLLRRAAAVRCDLVAQRVGGAWWNPGSLPAGEGLALVLGEDADPLASASASRARHMLKAALAENPAHKIVLLAADHPQYRDLFAAATARGCAVVTRPVDPWLVIERAGRVYAGGGETGFLALLAGREVRCFADSFYSGWGVTNDDAAVAQKPLRRTVDEIFAGACLLATRCLDPYRDCPASFEEIVAILAEWRKVEAANRRIAVCLGMSFWKRRRMTDFFCSTAGPPAFRRTTRGALAAAHGRPGGAIAVWASRTPQRLAAAAARQGVALLRVEDGFVRSVGLGSDFMPGASLVLDGRGMHFDPGAPSDLERLLVETKYDPALIERARRLIARLVARGITKYNLRMPAPALAFPSGRRRILVPGQVADDLSVRLGGGGIGGNLDLLARVRAANPGAFILYKPHPDVEAGHRKGAVPDCRALAFADAVLRGASAAAVLAEIDELHTLTSLAGFEALLRRRRVVVYGRPFYAGWGLTADLAPVDRGRRLSLEELVAGALILYPRYLDPATRLPCAPEIVIDRLDDPQLWRPGPLVAARRIQGMLMQRWHRAVGSTVTLAKTVARPGRGDFATPAV